jgi:hypothetical protein
VTLNLKRKHLKSVTAALCTGIFAGALVYPSISQAVKASPKPQTPAAKRAGLKVVTRTPDPAPGRTKVPVEGSTGGPEFAMKMRAAGKPRLAATLPPKRQNVAAKTSPQNEPFTAYARTIRMGWNAPTPSLGTTFGLAVDGEYVITTADAITDAWTNSGDIKFFLDDTGQPVTLVGLDLQNNIAVFSAGVTARLEKSLNRQRLRFEPAELNESFVALTSSGVSVTAKRVATVNDFGGPRERYELANADIRSTAFVFDRYGRWVATVSPTEQREGRTFDATLAPAVQDVLRVIEMRPPTAVTRAALQAQSTAWQEKWTTSYLAAAQQGNGLRALNCAAEPMKVEDTKFAAQLNRTRLVRCLNTLPVTVARDYSMGVELVTGEVNLNEDVKSIVANDSTESGLFAKAFYGAKREIASVNLLTVPECEKTDVTNSKQRKVHVRFCTSALKNAQGLSDTTITVISADTGNKAQVSSLHLKGFDVKNSKKFMEWMIEAEAIR